jgi:hypothetical protein
MTFFIDKANVTTHTRYSKNLLKNSKISSKMLPHTLHIHLQREYDNNHLNPPKVLFFRRHVAESGAFICDIGVGLKVVFSPVAR